MSVYYSIRYKDSAHPNGYPYFFDPKTGKASWEIPASLVAGSVIKTDDLDTFLSVAAKANGSTDDSRVVPLYYSSPVARVLTPHEIEKLVALSNGHIRVAQPQPGYSLAVKYFSDMEKREAWAFHTDRFGLELLCHMVMVNQPALAICRHMLASNPANTDGRLEKDGKDIYKEKKSLLQGVPGQKKVTWTQKEYAHEGMQLNYLSIKCWQRFTETWALLERAARLGLMAAHQPGGAYHGLPVRVLSIGGGPGYELIAFERFFRRFLGGTTTGNGSGGGRGNACPPMHLVSLDLMPGWRPFVEAMDMHFDTYDIEKDDLMATAARVYRGAAAARGGNGGAADPASIVPFHGVTYVVISYVMIYVTTPAVISMFNSLLQPDGHGGGSAGVRAILVSERGQQTASVGMMEQRGAQVHRLIDQSSGLDERQSIWLHRDTRLGALKEGSLPTIFPNVPFEDRKEKQQKRKRYD